MLENSLEKFSDCVIEFITKENKMRKGLLVKKHSEHLNVLGDFSFPNTTQSWRGILKLEDLLTTSSNDNLLENVGKKPEDIIEASKVWILQVKAVKENKNRIHMFLLRPFAIHVGLSEGIKNNMILSRMMMEGTASVHIDPLCSGGNCITSLRLKHVTKSVENMYNIQNKCKVTLPKVFLTYKSTSKIDDGTMLLCGTVLNSKTGLKETTITANDFIKLRQEEMMLIAQHKYGVRVSTDSKWKEFIAHLGESAVVFELLQIKPSNAVKINFDHSSAGSSKGAAFILYNCARLETIIRTFNEKVEEGMYPSLPPFEATDFTLLTQEDEWTLVFNFILGLPSMLNMCVEVNEKYCDFRPHHICSFLSSMVRVFSQYYRKTRILTEPRKHLLPVMYARIHMLKVLNESLKTCLRIINIKSVSQM